MPSLQYADPSRGKVAWMFVSESLINAQIYPKRNVLPSSAEEPWEDFESGNDNWITDDGMVRDWFEIYDRNDLYKVVLQEEYTPVPTMETLLVLLTVDEEDVLKTTTTSRTTTIDGWT